MDAWATVLPVKLGLLPRRIPAIPGCRLVLLKRGVPGKILPARSIALQLDAGDGLRFDQTIAVRETFITDFDFEADLFSEDQVALRSRISVTLRTHENDESVAQVAIAADQLVGELKQAISRCLQRSLRAIPFEKLNAHLRSIEEDLAQNLSFYQGRGERPYHCTAISVASVRARDQRILSQKETELLREADRTTYEARRLAAEQESELRHVATRVGLKVRDEEAEIKTRILEKRAKINSEHGFAALPADIQREIYLREREAVIAAATGDRRFAEDVLRRVADGTRISNKDIDIQVDKNESKNLRTFLSGNGSPAPEVRSPERYDFAPGSNDEEQFDDEEFTESFPDDTETADPKP